MQWPLCFFGHKAPLIWRVIRSPQSPYESDFCANDRFYQAFLRFGCVWFFRVVGQKNIKKYAPKMVVKNGDESQGRK